jgi:hypothetical protein
MSKILKLIKNTVHQSFNRHKKKSKDRREGDISDFPY